MENAAKYLHLSSRLCKLSKVNHAALNLKIIVINVFALCEEKKKKGKKEFLVKNYRIKCEVILIMKFQVEIRIIYEKDSTNSDHLRNSKRQDLVY